MKVLLSWERGDVMEDENIQAATAMGTSRPRQGEAFWHEMVTTGRHSSCPRQKLV
jgi:hypothetical protein